MRSDGAVVIDLCESSDDDDDIEIVEAPPPPPPSTGRRGTKRTAAVAALVDEKPLVGWAEAVPAGLDAVVDVDAARAPGPAGFDAVVDVDAARAPGGFDAVVDVDAARAPGPAGFDAVVAQTPAPAEFDAVVDVDAATAPASPASDVVVAEPVPRRRQPTLPQLVGRRLVAGPVALVSGLDSSILGSLIDHEDALENDLLYQGCQHMCAVYGHRGAVMPPSVLSGMLYEAVCAADHVHCANAVNGLHTIQQVIPAHVGHRAGGWTPVLPFQNLERRSASSTLNERSELTGWQLILALVRVVAGVDPGARFRAFVGLETVAPRSARAVLAFLIRVFQDEDLDAGLAGSTERSLLQKCLAGSTNSVMQFCSTLWSCLANPGAAASGDALIVLQALLLQIYDCDDSIIEHIERWFANSTTPPESKELFLETVASSRLRRQLARFILHRRLGMHITARPGAIVQAAIDIMPDPLEAQAREVVLLLSALPPLKPVARKLLRRWLGDRPWASDLRRGNL